MDPIPIFVHQILLPSTLLQYLNNTAAPCEDFYEFACGNYGQTHPIPDDDSVMSSFRYQHHYKSVDMAKLLQQTVASDDIKPVQAAKNLYASCMDVGTLAQQGLQPLKEIITSMSSIPIFDDCWDENQFDFMELGSQTFEKFGFYPFVAINTIANSYLKRNILELKAGALAMENEKFYLDSQYVHVLERYRNFNIDLALRFNVNKKIAERDVDNYIDFEIELAKILKQDTSDGFFADGRKYALLTIDNLLESYSEIPFKRLFDDLSFNGWNYNGSQQVYLKNPHYFEQLMATVNKTPKRVLANYVMFHIIHKLSSAITPIIRNDYRSYFENTHKIAADEDRWVECLNRVTEAFPLVLLSMYVKIRVNPEDKEEVEEMTFNIRKSMQNAILASDWLDNRTRTDAYAKLQLLTSTVGYPTLILNETELSAESPEVSFDKQEYLMNCKKLYKAEISKLIRAFTVPFDPMESLIKGLLTTINPHYVDTYNHVIIPAPLLHFPFYIDGAPSYVNYAMIGSIIAHEIAYALTYSGIVQDLAGTRAGWFQADILNADDCRRQCLIDQYSRINDPVTGLNLNGELQLAGNAADNIGIVHAFQAYKTSSGQQSSAESTLSHEDNYTINQLFFLSYARTWCVNISPESLKNEILHYDHAPFRYRVNVPLQNFDEFAEAFNCPRGSPMNPESKCRLLEPKD